MTYFERIFVFATPRKIFDYMMYSTVKLLIELYWVIDIRNILFCIIEK